MHFLSSPPNPPPTFFSNHSQYTPQTPSPLRTSRNANLMPPPPPTPTPDLTRSSPPSDSGAESTIYDENATLSPPTPSFPFSFSIQPPSSKGSSFEKRARSASPQINLSTRTSENRDRRKSLFLDRIKQRRDDERFESRGDQVLRMDFVRERRAWEEKLRRRALDVDVDVDVEMEMEMDEVERGDRDGADDVGPSPTEDREIEELVRCFENDANSSVLGRSDDGQHWHDADRQQQQQQRPSDEMSDDEDYDRLFMEVISAGQEQEVATAGMGVCWPDVTGAGSLDSSMDIS